MNNENSTFIAMAEAAEAKFDTFAATNKALLGQFDALADQIMTVREDACHAPDFHERKVIGELERLKDHMMASHQEIAEQMAKLYSLARRYRELAGQPSPKLVERYIAEHA